MFEMIKGNPQVKDYLGRLLAKEAIPNSLLFAGPDGIGKSLFAETFAKLANNLEKISHPDIRIYRPEGKIGMHSIDSLRRFNEEVYQSPYSAKYKFFIVHDADRMLSYSANALLKTFEEPIHTSIIILLSSSPESLLPTVLSRCQTVRFKQLQREEIALMVQQHCGKSKVDADMIAQLSRGSLGNAFKMASQGVDPLRLLILNSLSQGRFSTYTLLLASLAEIVEHIEKAQQSMGETARQTLEKQYPEGAPAAQQQAIDKEVEGLMTMLAMQEVQAVFDLVISWYRDMHLLHLGGSRDYLLNPDFVEAIDQALQRGESKPLENVLGVISEVKRGYERSAPLASTLESLFLQLLY